MAEQNEFTEKAFTFKQAAQMLNVSSKTISRMNVTGEICRPVRILGQLRFIKSEFIAWFRSGAPNRKTWEMMRKDILGW